MRIAAGSVRCFVIFRKEENILETIRHQLILRESHLSMSRNQFFFFWLRANSLTFLRYSSRLVLYRFRGSSWAGLSRFGSSLMSFWMPSRICLMVIEGFQSSSYSNPLEYVVEYGQAYCSRRVDVGMWKNRLEYTFRGPTIGQLVT